jgi:hypothetical protein
LDGSDIVAITIKFLRGKIMKWCQTCKLEYEDYVEKCTDCGAMLISEMDYNLHTKLKHSEYSLEEINLSVVYESTLESDVLHVAELLKDNGIDSEIKNHGIGSYLQIYSGVNYLGTSICVKEDDGEAAKALIDNFWGETKSDPLLQVNPDLVTDEDESSMEDYRHEYNKSLNRKRTFLKLFLLLILGTAIVIQLLSILS